MIGIIKKIQPLLLMLLFYACQSNDETNNSCLNIDENNSDILLSINATILSSWTDSISKKINVEAQIKNNSDDTIRAIGLSCPKGYNQIVSNNNYEIFKDLSCYSTAIQITKYPPHKVITEYFLIEEKSHSNESFKVGLKIYNIPQKTPQGKYSELLQLAKTKSVIYWSNNLYTNH